jgi:2,4-dienoyl-CoA reductase-like NADH-dependent reductase (Old Yellow Enzyme family)
VVQNGEADFVSLCRPLIREPGIIDEWKKGKIRQLACISCNKCLESLRTKDGLHCPMEKTNAEKASSPG